MNPPTSRPSGRARIRLGATFLALVLALATVFSSPVSATSSPSENPTDSASFSSLRLSDDELVNAKRLTRSETTTQPVAPALVKQAPNVAHQTTKPVPSVRLTNSGTLPHGGFIHGVITLNGKRLTGASKVLLQLWIDGDYLEAEFDAVNGEVIAGYELPPEDIGLPAEVALVSLETAQSGVGSSSKRKVTIVDLPQPVITSPPTSRYYNPVGDLSIGVATPSSVYLPNGALDVHSIAHFNSGPKSAEAPVVNGVAEFTYVSDQRILPISFWIPGTWFNKPASVPTRNYRISTGITLAISPPRSSVLSRRGVIQIQLVGDGLNLAQGQPVYMYVTVGGRNFKFQGTIHRNVVAISYSLPESMIDRTAQVRFQTELGPVMSASSTSMRNYKITK